MRHGEDASTPDRMALDDPALSMVYADMGAYLAFESAVCWECPGCAGCVGACKDGFRDSHVPCFCDPPEDSA